MESVFISGLAISDFRNSISTIETEIKKSRSPKIDDIESLIHAAGNVSIGLVQIDKKKSDEFEGFVDNFISLLVQSSHLNYCRHIDRVKFNNVVINKKSDIELLDTSLQALKVSEENAAKANALVLEQCNIGAIAAFNYRWLYSEENSICILQKKGSIKCRSSMLQRLLVLMLYLEKKVRSCLMLFAKVLLTKTGLR